MEQYKPVIKARAVHAVQRCMPPLGCCVLHAMLNGAPIRFSSCHNVCCLQEEVLSYLDLVAQQQADAAEAPAPQPAAQAAAAPSAGSKRKLESREQGQHAGGTMLPLSELKRVDVRLFKGQVQVDIRWAAASMSGRHVLARKFESTCSAFRTCDICHSTGMPQRPTCCP